MGTIKDKLDKLLATKEDIKSAIESKGQNPGDVFADYPAKILAIETGIDTSDATAAASDVASGKTAYVNGQKVTGTVETVEANYSKVFDPYASVSSLVPSGGYIRPGFKPENDMLFRQNSYAFINIPLSSMGDAAAANVLSGKTFTSTAGVKVTGTMPSKAAQSYRPSTSAQTITAGQYLSGAQTIQGDVNLTAANIKKGVSIFGVAGSYEGSYSSGSITVVNNSSYSVELCNIVTLNSPGTHYENLYANNSRTFYTPIGTLFLVVMKNNQSINVSGGAMRLYGNWDGTEYYCWGYLGSGYTSGTVTITN